MEIPTIFLKRSEPEGEKVVGAKRGLSLFLCIALLTAAGSHKEKGERRRARRAYPKK